MSEARKKYFDTRVIQRFMQGDKDAFEEIFKYYRTHVYWMGYHFFANEEKAKDLVQAVFLEIFQTIKNLKEAERFYVWMNRIAYHRCLQMIRYDKKDSLYYAKEIIENFQEEAWGDAGSSAVLTEIQQEQAIQIIIDTLETLPPEQKTIGYLRCFENLSWSEIGEITEMPIGTVSSCFSRIRPMLKKALEKQGFTSATCFSLLLLPNLSSYYHMMTKQYPTLQTAESAAMLVTIQQTHLKRVHKKNTKWEVGAYGVVGCSVAALGVMLMIPRAQGQEAAWKESLTTAQIESINFPQELTNQPFQLDVKTTHQHYDAILLNGSPNLSVDWNGTYRIDLVESDKIIDSKEIAITNLDRDIPIVIEEYFQQGVMNFKVVDKDSEVDFSSIELEVNGLKSTDFSVDIQQSLIAIPIELQNNYILKVADLAGNVLEIKVNYFERLKE